MPKYEVIGSRVEGLLGERLDEIRVTGLNNLQGVLVYTSQGGFLF